MKDVKMALELVKVARLVKASVVDDALRVLEAGYPEAVKTSVFRDAWKGVSDALEESPMFGYIKGMIRDGKRWSAFSERDDGDERVEPLHIHYRIYPKLIIYHSDNSKEVDLMVDMREVRGFEAVGHRHVNGVVRLSLDRNRDSKTLILNAVKDFISGKNVGRALFEEYGPPDLSGLRGGI